MKASEIKVGGRYKANVSGVLTTVRVDRIETGDAYDRGFRKSTRYHVTNLKTGRKTTFRSAAKFRSRTADNEQRPLTPLEESIKTKLTGTAEEGEQGSDPTPAQTSSPRSLTTAPKPEASPRGPSLNAVVAARAAAPAKPIDKSPHLIVEARAGTGKTTTLVSALQRLKGIEPRSGNGAPMVPSPQQAAVWDAVARSPKDSTVTFVAFNKSIATELQRRVPAGCSASTMHSLGFAACRRALGKLEPTEWAVPDLIAELLGTNPRDLRKNKPVVLKATDQLVSLCKMNLVGAEFNAGANGWDEELDALARHYDVDLDRHRKDVFDLVPRVLDRCRDPKGRINFDDMIWLPVVLGLPVTKADLLLVDEAQDLNRCQQALAKMAGHRLVLCGDPRQAIYGFAGADAESMKRMETELSGQQHTPWGVGIEPDARGCETLPLTVTRRCGKAIVEEARRWVPDFEAHESNPEGTITEARYPVRKMPGGGTEQVPWEQTYGPRVEPGDMVTCRTNAPLVTNCFAFIKRGLKANIQGRDVGKGLQTLVRKLVKEDEHMPTPELVGRLDDWLAGEVSKEEARRNSSATRVQGLQDRHGCLVAFAEGARDAADVLGKIDQVFTDDKHAPGVRFSSIHRAKGLESLRVFSLRPPDGGMRTDKMKGWELEQEENLRYVEVTRAIHEFCVVS